MTVRLTSSFTTKVQLSKFDTNSAFLSLCVQSFSLESMQTFYSWSDNESPMLLNPFNMKQAITVQMFSWENLNVTDKFSLSPPNNSLPV